MSAVIFIPARYASSRYPGKPLVELAGATGEKKSLIQRAWEAALTVEGVSAVYVLTDDDRIADAADLARVTDRDRATARIGDLVAPQTQPGQLHAAVARAGPAGGLVVCHP